MTKEEAFEEFQKIARTVKNWRANDDWHNVVYDRYNALFSYVYCVNGKDPGPWTMPPVPEGVEP